MLIEDIWFDLKDGRKALIRSPKEEDIPGLLEYLVKTAEETDFILRYPEECKRYTYEGEKALIEQTSASEYDAFLVCIVDGKLAGNSHLMFDRKIKTRHRANIGIALIKEFWNLGIGTKMFEEMIRITKEHGGIKQMELEFVEGNTRARHLYEKMGFRIVSMHPNAICLKDGTLLNEYLMIRPMEED